MNIVLQFTMIFIMTISGSFGALFFKRATDGQEGINLFKLISRSALYIGGTFYLLGAALNIILLRYMDYTVVYPMTALTYIWTMIISYIILGEKINKNKVLAIIFITAGVVVLNI